METQKIINLLIDLSNEESKFVTKMAFHKHQKTNTTETILSNLRQTNLN